MNTPQIIRSDSGRVVVARLPGQSPKGGELARTAAMLCANASFQKFSIEQFGGAAPGVSAAEHAAAFVRAACAIGSRAQLDHDSNAAYRFHQRIRKPFINWKAAQ